MKEKESLFALNNNVKNNNSEEGKIVTTANSSKAEKPIIEDENSMNESPFNVLEDKLVGPIPIYFSPSPQKHHSLNITNALSTNNILPPKQNSTNSTHELKSNSISFSSSISPPSIDHTNTYPPPHVVNKSIATPSKSFNARKKRPLSINSARKRIRGRGSEVISFRHQLFDNNIASPNISLPTIQKSTYEIQKIGTDNDDDKDDEEYQKFVASLFSNHELSHTPSNVAHTGGVDVDDDDEASYHLPEIDDDDDEYDDLSRSIATKPDSNPFPNPFSSCIENKDSRSSPLLTDLVNKNEEDEDSIYNDLEAELGDLLEEDLLATVSSLMHQTPTPPKQKQNSSQKKNNKHHVSQD